MKQFIATLLFFVFSGVVYAQPLSAENILRNVKKQFDHVEDYTAVLTAKVDMERLHIPEMKIKIYFKQPNKVHIESKNFAILPRQGIALNPSDLLSKFDASLMNTENRNGTSFYRLRLVSKPDEKHPPRESFIWIDGSRWVITELETSPSEGRTIKVTFEYTTVEDKYILPAVMKASFDFTASSDTLTQQMYGGRNSIPRKGNVELLYSDYQVNTGLRDEIFEKKESNQK